MHQKTNRPLVAASGAVDCKVDDRRQKQSTVSPKPDRDLTTTGVTGRKFGHWTAVQVDTTGKRVHCQCVCGRIRVLGIDELEAGAISSCGCRPPTLHERVAIRAEQARRKGGAS